MNILSLFDGMSVAQNALKQLSIKVDNYYASEVDKYAIASTQRNFPNTIQLGDVTLLNESNLPKDIDLLVAGFPCQAFSIAGARKEFADPRGQLFFDMMRVISIVKPKYFILENVASMKKETQKYISLIIGVEPIMIDASLVSAQSRKRLFWVAKLNNEGVYEQMIVSQPQDRGILLKDIIEDPDTDRLKSYCIDASYYKGTNIEHYLEDGRRQVVFAQKRNDRSSKVLGDKSTTLTSSYSGFPDGGNRMGVIKYIGGIGTKNWVGDGKLLSRNVPQGQRVYDSEGKSVTLSSNSGGFGGKTGLYAIASRGRNIVDGNRKDIIGAKTVQKLEIGGEKANTITSVQKDSMLLDGYVVRKLTPIECLRLQSLPDDYLDNITVNNKPLSNSQKYKMLGNAFNCEIIKHILANLWTI